MTQEKFIQLTVGAFQIFQAIVPIDTGNLRYNATNYDSTGERSCEFIVDGKIAPYAVYTNEPWLSPRWHGLKNPNEGWVQGGLELVAMYLSQQLGGAPIEWRTSTK